MGELADTPEENFTAEYVTLLQIMCNMFNQVYIPRERREHRIFQELLKSVAGLEERLMQGGDDEVDIVAELASIVHRSYYVFELSAYLIYH
jgi:hypothetical protein